MIHHGIDKVVNVDGFSANVVQKFFGFLPGPAPFWTWWSCRPCARYAGLSG